TGYCVHFAHAATFLMRALDVPARVAGGYAVEEGRRGSGSALMIRGLDAHAWPEIALEGVGWVVIDPQPRRTLDPPGQEADNSLQQMLGEALRKSSGRPPTDGGDFGVPWAVVRRFLILLSAVAVVLAFVVKAYRAAIPAFASPAQVYRVGYRAALDRLAEVGL